MKKFLAVTLTAAMALSLASCGSSAKSGEKIIGKWAMSDLSNTDQSVDGGEYDIRLYQWGENDEILNDAILKGAYDPETDSITAEGFFDPDSITVTFSYDSQRNVVWTENGESTVLEYSYRTN